MLSPASPENPLLHEAAMLLEANKPVTFSAIADMIARLNQAQSRELDLFAGTLAAAWAPYSLSRWATESKYVGEALRYGRMMDELRQLALLTPK